MVKKYKNIEIIEENEENEYTDDESIEIKKDKIPNKKEFIYEKPKKERKEYILTEARKAQIDKAREIKMRNAEMRRKEQEEKKRDYLLEKEKLNKIKEEKLKKKQDMEIRRLKKEVEELSEPEEEIIVKKKSKPKKKVVYVEESSEEEIEYIRPKPPKQKAPTYEKPLQLQRIIQYV